MPVAWIGAASLASGLMGADAASSAADATAGAADRATASQRAMFDKTMGNLTPFMGMGQGAMQKLSGLVGVGGTPGGAPAMTADQARAQLLPQFTAGVTNDVGAYANDPMAAQALRTQGIDPATWSQSGATGGGAVDEAGLQQAIQKLMASQPAAVPDSNASDYGSLLKPFGASDFQLDPGTQFRIKYGQQALQNSQAAKDGVLTGGALKDLMTFNQDYAGTGYQSAFDRYMAGKQMTLQSLAGLSNLGQASAAGGVNAGATYAKGIADTTLGAGQAQGAGMVGSANALSGGIGGASNAYFLSSLLNKNTAGTNSPGLLDSTAGQLINPIA